MAYKSACGNITVPIIVRLTVYPMQSEATKIIDRKRGQVKSAIALSEAAELVNPRAHIPTEATSAADDASLHPQWAVWAAINCFNHITCRQMQDFLSTGSR